MIFVHQTKGMQSFFRGIAATKDCSGQPEMHIVSRESGAYAFD
jgi:hypothetical protein